jgi:hypothetical protein
MKSRKDMEGWRDGGQNGAKNLSTISVKRGCDWIQKKPPNLFSSCSSRPHGDP